MFRCHVQTGHKKVNECMWIVKISKFKKIEERKIRKLTKVFIVPKSRRK